MKGVYFCFEMLFRNDAFWACFIFFNRQLMWGCFMVLFYEFYTSFHLVGLFLWRVSADLIDRCYRLFVQNRWTVACEWGASIFAPFDFLLILLCSQGTLPASVVTAFNVCFSEHNLSSAIVNFSLSSGNVVTSPASFSSHKSSRVYHFYHKIVSFTAFP